MSLSSSLCGSKYRTAEDTAERIRIRETEATSRSAAAMKSGERQQEMDNANDDVRDLVEK